MVRVRLDDLIRRVERERSRVVFGAKRHQVAGGIVLDRVTVERRQPIRPVVGTQHGAARVRRLDEIASAIVVVGRSTAGRGIRDQALGGVVLVGPRPLVAVGVLVGRSHESIGPVRVLELRDDPTVGVDVRDRLQLALRGEVPDGRQAVRIGPDHPVAATLILRVNGAHRPVDAGDAPDDVASVRHAPVAGGDRRHRAQIVVLVGQRRQVVALHADEAPESVVLIDGGARRVGHPDPAPELVEVENHRRPVGAARRLAQHASVRVGIAPNPRGPAVRRHRRRDLVSTGELEAPLEGVGAPEHQPGRRADQQHQAGRERGAAHRPLVNRHLAPPVETRPARGGGASVVARPPSSRVARDPGRRGSGRRYPPVPHLPARPCRHPMVLADRMEDCAYLVAAPEPNDDAGASPDDLY